MENTNQNTWKDWVFSWPTYVIMGVALAALVDRTQILQPVLDKLLKKEQV